MDRVVVCVCINLIVEEGFRRTLSYATTMEEIEESIIATRQRRSNAGNRLKSLLAAEEPLEDDEQIFLEIEGDDEFDPDMQDDELEQVDSEDSDQEKWGEGDMIASGQEDNDEYPERETVFKGSKKRSRVEQEEEDENFSSSSESSDHEESDQEAGEKELQKQQRLEKRKKRRMELPFLRKKQSSAGTSAPDRKKSKSATANSVLLASNLLASARRVSKRASAVRNKEEVIQRLQEQEARRAQYVAPMIKKQQALTQQERLEEAKITEQRNIASLNMYVEQEEIRRQKQRAAMQAKRVPMRAIIRFVSSTRFIAPRRIFIRSDIDMTVHKPGDKRIEPKTEEKIESNEAPKEKDESAKHEEKQSAVDEHTKDDSKEDPGHNRPENDQETNNKVTEEVNKVDGEESEDKNEEENNQEMEQENKEVDHLEESAAGETNQEESVTKDTNEVKIETNDDDNDTGEKAEADDNHTGNLSEKSPADDIVAIRKSRSAEPSADAVVNDEVLIEGEKSESDKPVKEQQGESSLEQPEIVSETVVVKDEEQVKKEEPAVIPPYLLPVQGPYVCRTRNTVNLLEFPSDFQYSRQAVKALLLGPRVLRTGIMPAAKSLRCALTGGKAKYIDPSSGVPYGSLQAYKALKQIEANEYAWITEFGGMFSGLRNGQRHARGVPEGFDD